MEIKEKKEKEPELKQIPLFLFSGWWTVLLFQFLKGFHKVSGKFLVIIFCQDIFFTEQYLLQFPHFYQMVYVFRGKRRSQSVISLFFQVGKGVRTTTQRKGTGVSVSGALVSGRRIKPRRGGLLWRLRKKKKKSRS